MAVLETDVLVVGAGPVGLTAALELRRRGVDVMVVDRIVDPPQYAKAVGIQPRTLEHWDAAGVVRPALDACTVLRGQLLYRDGELVNQLDLPLPGDAPYGFIALPQYETERVLTDALAAHGTHVARGVEFVAAEQDADGVRSTLQDTAGGEWTVTSRYLVGCDGAHSAVRRGLGIGFSGDAFAEGYMLGDVEVDWDLPTGYGVRATRSRNDEPDDIMVCIPLPGVRRYRVSSLVDPELQSPERSTAGGDGVVHGLQGGRTPGLEHIQRVLDRLAPVPTTASTMRWSSVFRISHRLADRYGDGRIFLAGDAAHIHPPTGGQGLNTGVQDATNLSWKLALVCAGRADASLLESYHAERHPVGEEVVGRTVERARAGFGTETTGLEAMLMREAQLLVGYPDSPVVGEDGSFTGGPRPGQRVPEVDGLRQDIVRRPIRLAELLRHPDLTVLLWSATSEPMRDLVAAASRPGVRCSVIGPAPDPAAGAVFADPDGAFAAAFGTDGLDRAAWVVRPDGYLGHRVAGVDADRLAKALTGTGLLG